MNQSSPENRAPRETDCGNFGSAEPFGPWRRPMSTSVHWTETTVELPGVREGGMSGWNEQRKPGTTRGSPRRSRTAKASRISRRAVKSRCACEWDGWGRLSEDGPGHYNPDLSEDPLGRRINDPPGRCAIRVCGLTQCRITVATTKCTKGDANWTSDGACWEQA